MQKRNLTFIPVTILVMLLLTPGLLPQDSLAAPQLQQGHNVEFVAKLSLPGNSHSVVTSGNYAYVSTRDSSLRVVDISDPSHPRHVGGANTPGSSWDVAVVEPYAYVVDGWHGLRVVDISNPSRPREVASVDTNNAIGITVAGSYAYVTDSDRGLRIIDISVPTRPRLVGSRDTPGWAWGVAVADGYAFVADGPGGLRVMDVSNPTSPYEVGAYDTPGYAADIVVVDGYAYVADGGAGLRIVDVSSPTSPYEVGDYDTPGSAQGLTVVGRYAYISDWDAGLRIVDISDPTNPHEVGYYDTAGYADDAAVSGDYIYIADRGGDLVVLRFTPGGPLPDLTITAIEVTQGIQCVDNPNCFGDPEVTSQTRGPRESASPVASTRASESTPFFVAVTRDDEIYAFPLTDQPHEGYFVGTGNIAAVADFDNDSYCEVLAASSTDRFLRLYENDAAMNFTASVVSDDAYPSTGFSTMFGGDSAVGDFDDNGLIDFVFTGRRCSSGPFCPPGGEGLVQLHLNRGNNHFDRRSIDITGVSNRPYEGITGLDDGDFNMDGYLDLAAQQYYATGTTNITHLLLGNGDASFFDSPAFANANRDGTLSLVSGDFNSDGHLDLIVGQDDDGDPGQTWLYVGDGTGEFTFSGPAYDTAPGIESGRNRSGSGHADAYDVDGDGNLDVVAASDGIGLLLFKGNGDGSFQPAVVLHNGTNWFRVASPSETLPPCRFGPSPDLTVSAIEVTQGIQCLDNPDCFGADYHGLCFEDDCDNAVPLVAGKPIWVRVYPDCGTGCGWINGVTAKLSVRRGDHETVLESYPLTVYHPEDPSVIRGVGGRTFNFALPPELWSAGSLELQAEINPAGPNQLPESRTDNNYYPTPPVVFGLQPRRALAIDYLPLHYDPPGYGGPTNPTERIRNAHWWARKVYPLSEIHYSAWQGPGLTVGCSLSGIEGIVCKHRLKTLMNQIYEQTSPERRPDQLFGWLPDGVLGNWRGQDYDGDSDPRYAGGAGRIAFAEDLPGYLGSRIFAHEVAHNLGRMHTISTDDCPMPGGPTDWPYENSHIQEYGFDGAVVPSDYNDLMSYCRYFWISPYTYGRLFDALAPASSVANLASDPLGTFLVSGIVHADDSVEFMPVYRISNSTDSGPPRGTEYCVETLNENAQSLQSRCFDLAFFDGEAGEPTTVDSFTLSIPYDSSAVRIILRHNQALIGEISASANSPSIEIVSPNGGESWSGTENVTWIANDADGDPLTYSVLYSSDGGQSWIPLVVDVTETSYDFDTNQIAGTTHAVIRVVASDGFNTAEDASDARFNVTTKSPEALILAPEDGATAPPSTPVLLSGQGYDLEDGPLTDEALSWHSDRDGSLGTGGYFVSTDLSPGQHTITLTVTDSDGNQSTATISLYVGHRTYLPLITKD